MKCFLAFLCCDHLAECPISKSRFCPFLCCKICAQPHLSSKSCYLFWVLNPVFTILSRFSVGNSPAMTAIYLGVVARALRMSLNASLRHLRESPERFCVLIPHISFPIRISMRLNIFVYTISVVTVDFNSLSDSLCPDES